MKHLAIIPLFVLCAFGSINAMADVTCATPTQAVQGGSWDLLCSDDGSENTDYSCSISLHITTQYDDTPDDLLVNGTVGQNQQNVPVWFGARFNEQNITAVSVNSVDCDAQE